MNWNTEKINKRREEEIILNSISQILLEEDLQEDETTDMFPDATTLEAAERSFYDVLGQKFCSSSSSTSNKIPPLINSLNSHKYYTSIHSNDAIGNLHHHPGSSYNNYNINPPLPLPNFYYLQPSSSSHSLCPSSSNNACETPLTGLFEKKNNTFPLEFNEISSTISSHHHHHHHHHLSSAMRKRKNHHQPTESTHESQRNITNYKHLPLYYPEDESDKYIDLFDHVLLSCNGEDQDSKGKGCGIVGGSIRRKKQGVDDIEDLVDMRALLTTCAEAVAVNDLKSANELLFQIRLHSSCFGNSSQRLAYSFANALHARISATGNEVYGALKGAKLFTVVDKLKACRCFLSASPFIKTSNFLVHQTVLELAEKANAVHVIDFGIGHGFQWPSLIQRLSKRPGGPPLLRITGIDVPLPGFRPEARVEETGIRLAKYCKRFNVPFEYKCIAETRWETISHEHLQINHREDEVTVVNCLYRFRHLLDETVTPNNNPRDGVLGLIRRIKPDVFVHGVINGSYDAPFFMSRFKEALYHFSAVFDMMEASSGSQVQDRDRIMFEQEVLGKEILNVIGCEGMERIERPEMYRQWQVRHGRAGLRQLPLNREVMKKVKEQVKSNYHKDFVVDEDGEWMLQGWKGRILYALSSWKPAYLGLIL